ncbi:MAG TPA: (Fe-S)-binding protein [Gemmatimonadaceae bacterium]|nr:(Fe-S)-binding protein [Gemmatimonadaceae bacterium]
MATNALPGNDFAACTGCSLCLLVCPVWRATHDIRLTPHGRAKALQHGATAVDLIESIASCTFCGACEPACPEGIDLIGMIVGLRQQLPASSARNLSVAQTPLHSSSRSQSPAHGAPSVVLADQSLRDHPDILACVVSLLGVQNNDDNGADISCALETGTLVSPSRIEAFVEPLQRKGRIVVADGLLLRHLRAWLPRTRIESIGAALSRLPALRRQLRSSDLYVIEPRGYHADYERQVRHYDALRVETGCETNLDLQRIAIPAIARNLSQRLDASVPRDLESARWILHRRRMSRIVVESVDDIRVFEQITDCPVVHVAHLVDPPATTERGAW